MRTSYEITAADFADLIAAIKPEPMIALQCGAPRSVQERANAAWAVLGKKMNFDPMSVQPNGRGDRFFSANALAPVEKPRLLKDGNEWCAQAPGFINLAESVAGFGATPVEAYKDLERQVRQP